MTNINCIADCIYQKDGKCSYENIHVQSLSFNKDCAYFMPLKNQKNLQSNS